MLLEIKMPGMRIVSKANRREHWKKTWKRESAQRAELRLAHGKAIGELSLPVEVTFYRIGPTPQDEGDNLPVAFKHLRDEMANLLGLPKQKGQEFSDDSDSRVSWQYGQRRGKWACEIVIAPRKES